MRWPQDPTKPLSPDEVFGPSKPGDDSTAARRTAEIRRALGRAAPVDTLVDPEEERKRRQREIRAALGKEPEEPQPKSRADQAAQDLYDRYSKQREKEVKDRWGKLGYTLPITDAADRAVGIVPYLAGKLVFEPAAGTAAYLAEKAGLISPETSERVYDWAKRASRRLATPGATIAYLAQRPWAKDDAIDLADDARYAPRIPYVTTAAEFGASLLPIGGQIAAQNRALADLGRTLPATSRLGQALRTFGYNQRISLPAAAARGAVEGLPVDYAYLAQAADEAGGWDKLPPEAFAMAALFGPGIGAGVGAGLEWRARTKPLRDLRRAQKKYPLEKRDIYGHEPDLDPKNTSEAVRQALGVEPGEVDRQRAAAGLPPPPKQLPPGEKVVEDATRSLAKADEAIGTGLTPEQALEIAELQGRMSQIQRMIESGDLDPEARKGLQDLLDEIARQLEPLLEAAGIKPADAPSGRPIEMPPVRETDVPPDPMPEPSVPETPAPAAAAPPEAPATFGPGAQVRKRGSSIVQGEIIGEGRPQMRRKGERYWTVKLKSGRERIYPESELELLGGSPAGGAELQEAASRVIAGGVAGSAVGGAVGGALGGEEGAEIGAEIGLAIGSGAPLSRAMYRNYQQLRATRSAGRPAEPRIFISRDAVMEKETSLASGTTYKYHYVDLPNYGTYMVEPVDLATEVPDVIYHVTPWIREIQETGMLLAYGGYDRGGLGGSTRFPGVSFSTSFDDAKRITRDLLRAGKIMRGEATPASIRQWAAEDAAYYGISPKALERAVEHLGHRFEEGIRGVSDTRWRNRELFYRYLTYLTTREEVSKRLGNPIPDPILSGVSDSYAQLREGNLGIVAVPKADIPTSALVEKGVDAFNTEIRVHADVPVPNARYHMASDWGLERSPARQVAERTGEQVGGAALGAGAGYTAGLFGEDEADRWKGFAAGGAAGLGFATMRPHMRNRPGFARLPGREEGPRFYSRLARRIAEGPRRATVQQWRKHLEKNTSKVEREWTGIEDLLSKQDPGSMLTKEEVQAVFDRNQIQVSERTYGSNLVNELVARRDALTTEAQDAVEGIYRLKFQFDRAIAGRLQSPPEFWTLIRSEARPKLELLGLDADITAKMYELLDRARQLWKTVETNQQEIDRLQSEIARHGQTRYSDWTEPGGAHYQEHLLILDPRPERQRVSKAHKDAQDRLLELDRNMAAAFEELRTAAAEAGLPADWANLVRDHHDVEAFAQLRRVSDPVIRDRLTDLWNEFATRRADYDLAEEAVIEATNALIAARKAEQKGPLAQFQSPHWPQSNVIVHTRTKEYVDAHGRRVRHIGEIQSDWAQQGREWGFIKPDKHQAREAFEERLRQDVARYYDLSPDLVSRHEGVNILTTLRGDGARVAREIWGDQLEALRREWTSLIGSVPWMPFGRTEDWVSLALKREVDRAVRDGIDVITFSTGEAQSRLYNLSRYASKIEFTESDGLFRAYNDYGDPVFTKEGVTRGELPGIIGKELTENLLQAPENQHGTRTISGEAMRVGGAGMRKFYDEIIPATVKKYARQMGVELKLEDIAIPDIAGHGAPYDIRLPVEHTPNGLRRLAQRYGAPGAPLRKTLENMAANMEDFRVPAAEALRAEAWHMGLDHPRIQRLIEILDAEVDYYPEAKRPGFVIPRTLRAIIQKAGQPLLGVGGYLAGEELTGEEEAGLLAAGAMMFGRGRGWRGLPREVRRALRRFSDAELAQLARQMEREGNYPSAETLRSELAWRRAESGEARAPTPEPKPEGSTESFVERFLEHLRRPAQELDDLDLDELLKPINDLSDHIHDHSGDRTRLRQIQERLDKALEDPSFDEEGRQWIMELRNDIDDLLAGFDAGGEMAPWEQSSWQGADPDAWRHGAEATSTPPARESPDAATLIESYRAEFEQGRIPPLSEGEMIELETVFRSATEEEKAEIARLVNEIASRAIERQHRSMANWAILRSDLQDLASGVEPLRYFPKDAEELVERAGVGDLVGRAGGRLGGDPYLLREQAIKALRDWKEAVEVGNPIPDEEIEQVARRVQRIFVQGDDISRRTIRRDLDELIDSLHDSGYHDEAFDFEALRNYLDLNEPNMHSFVPAIPALMQLGGMGLDLFDEDDPLLPSGPAMVVSLMALALAAPATRQRIRQLARRLHPNIDEESAFRQVYGAARGIQRVIRDAIGSQFTQYGEPVRGWADTERDLATDIWLRGRLEIARTGRVVEQQIAEAMAPFVKSRHEAFRDIVRDLFGGRSPWHSAKERRESRKRIQQAVEAIAGVDFEGRPIFGAINREALGPGRGRVENLPRRVREAIEAWREGELSPEMQQRLAGLWRTSSDGKTVYNPDTARQLWESLTDAEREVASRIIAPEHHAYRIRAEKAHQRVLRTRELLEARLKAYRDLTRSGSAVPGRTKAELAMRYQSEIQALTATLDDDLDQLAYLVQMWGEAEARGFRQAYVKDELPNLDRMSREHMRILHEELDRNIEGWMHHRGFDRKSFTGLLGKLRKAVAPVRRHRRGKLGWEEDIARSMYDALVGLREAEIKNRLGEYLEMAATIPKARHEKVAPAGYHDKPYKLQFGRKAGEEVWIKKHIYDDWVREIERASTGSPAEGARETMRGAEEYLDSLMRYWTKNQLIAMQSAVNNLSGFMLVLMRSAEHLNRAVLSGDVSEAKKQIVRALRYPAAMMQNFPDFLRESVPLAQAVVGMPDAGPIRVGGMDALTRTGLGAAAGAGIGAFLGPTLGADSRLEGALYGAGAGALAGQIGGVRTLRGLGPEEFGEVFTQQFARPGSGEVHIPWATRTLAGASIGAAGGGAYGYFAEDVDFLEGLGKGALVGAGIGQLNLRPLHRVQDALLSPFQAVDLWIKRATAAVERLNAAEDVADRLIREGRLDPKDRAKQIIKLARVDYLEQAGRRESSEAFAHTLLQELQQVERRLEQLDEILGPRTTPERAAIGVEEQLPSGHGKVPAVIEEGPKIRGSRRGERELERMSRRRELEMERERLLVRREVLDEAVDRAIRSAQVEGAEEVARYEVGREDLRARSYYAPDYALAPTWLNRANRKWWGMGSFPFAKWGYFLTRTIYHHLVDPILNDKVPLKKRLAALAAFIELVAPFYYWGIKTEEESQADIVTTEKARSGMSYAIDRGGRANLSLVPVIGPATHQALGLDPDTHELHLRTVKYPLADVGLVASSLRAGNVEGLGQAAQEKVTPGPLLQGAAALAGWRNKYNVYDPQSAIMGTVLSSFVPGHRVVEDIGRTHWPGSYRPETFIQGLAGDLARPFLGGEGFPLYGRSRQDRGMPRIFTFMRTAQHPPLVQDRDLARLAVMWGINIKDVPKLRAMIERQEAGKRAIQRQIRGELYPQVVEPVSAELIRALEALREAEKKRVRDRVR